MVGPDPFELLTAEHERIRGRIRNAVSVARVPGPSHGVELGRLLADLRRHLRREEEALYPVCERLFGGQEGAVAVLRRDHAAIERDAASLDRLQAGGPRSKHRQRLERLGRRVEAHLTQEEHVLFPLTAARMSEAEAAHLLQRLRRRPPR